MYNTGTQCNAGVCDADARHDDDDFSSLAAQSIYLVTYLHISGGRPLPSMPVRWCIVHTVQVSSTIGFRNTRKSPSVTKVSYKLTPKVVLFQKKKKKKKKKTRSAKAEPISVF